MPTCWECGDLPIYSFLQSTAFTISISPLFLLFYNLSRHLYFILFCVCAEYTHPCKQDVCTSMWRPEVDIQCLSQLILHFLFFEIRYLTEHKYYWFSWLASKFLMSVGLCPKCWGNRHIAVLWGCWGFELGSSYSKCS